MNIMSTIMLHLVEEDAKKSVIDVCLQLARLDQRLADIAQWLPDDRAVRLFDPAGMFVSLSTAISTVRGKHITAAIDTLRSAVLADSAVREGGEP